MTPGDPQSWARAVENQSFRISEVERIVFRAHPEVIQAIDADEADDHAPRRGSTWMWIRVGLVPLFAPPVVAMKALFDLCVSTLTWVPAGAR
ncbi:hypothetical protein [Microbacterium sp. NPDC057650]|uniref:hypothetical protein n=1 Tax=unclassified Microbacterium TaxID=2609290 RepID=UPI00366DBA98